MRLLQVTPTFYPAVVWGGPIQTTYRLCNALSRKRDVCIRVLTTDSAGPERGARVKLDNMPTHNTYEILYCKRRLAVSFSFELLRKLPSMIRWADIVHLNAVYSSPTIPTLALSKLMSKPVVWSPRGALQRWERSSRPVAKLVWEKICDSLCDKERVTLHFTSEAELKQSAGRIKRASMVVVPNGVDSQPNDKHAASGETSLRLLYLGRLHPIKGIENLLIAMQDLDSSVTLSICGEGDGGYESKLKKMSHSLGVGNRVTFWGPVVDENKSHCFTEADVFVMPSFNESFGLAAAEAMSHGLPVIVSNKTPWSEVEERGCGFWVDNAPASLAAAIKRISQMPINEMGQKGRAWIMHDFSWDVIAERMAELYISLIRQNAN